MTLDLRDPRSARPGAHARHSAGVPDRARPRATVAMEVLAA